MRIGFVEYINALPFSLPIKLGVATGNFNLTLAIPSQLNALLKEEALDAALTSSVEYLDGPYKLLSGYGIAAKKEILSVNLYKKKGPLKEVALTHHSATSVSLLKVLLHAWGEEPNFVPLERNRPLASYEAFLLIGDEALQNVTLPGYETIDLAKAWHDLTGLPFVFAVFSLNKDLESRQLISLKDALESSLNWTNEHFDTLIQYAKKQTNLPDALIRRYYSLCIYRLGDKELEGLEKFRELRKNVQPILT